jgi:lipid A ethanolaminephosphotransferase
VSDDRGWRWPHLNPFQLIVCVAILLVSFYNRGVWKALLTLVPYEGLSTAAFYASFGVFLVAFFSLLLLLLSFRYVLKPALMLLLLVSAGTLYFISSYGVSIDKDMIQNVFETDMRETKALLTPRMALYLIGLGVVPAILVWLQPVRYPTLWRGWWQRLLGMVCALVVVAAVVAPFYLTYASIFRQEDKLTHFINPTNVVYGTSKYIKTVLGIKKVHAIIPIGLDGKFGAQITGRPKKSLVILVVGETARADHFSLNGYGRNTNPELQKQDILNYGDVSSCGTATAVSVPCMFSRFNREDYGDKKGKTTENVLDILQRAGLNVFWRTNNSGDCKGVCARIPYEDMSRSENPALCKDGECLDEILLESLQSYVDKQIGDALVVFHSNGSHGPEYFRRYPASMERFTPVCRTNQLGSCTNEELVNVYDNTILYTDYFLNQVIEFLKRNSQTRDTAMLYVSDHGESLGEDGMYLHGAPYAIAPDAQTRVPILAWFSPNAFTNWGLSQDCLRQNQSAKLTHDNVFHTLLGLFDVQTQEYKSELDMFLPCRAAVK